MSDSNPDVLVIGAGVAGLAAARDLVSAGVRVVMLEARDRIGGRIHTLHDPAWPLPVELGAEFIHGKPRETWSLIEAAGLSVYGVTDSHWQTDRDGKLDRSDDFWDQIERVLGRLESLEDDDRRPFGEFLESRAAAHLPADAKELAARYVEGINAADKNVISALSLRDSERASRRIGGTKLFRLQGGYDRIPRWLRAGIEPRAAELRLNTIVDAIHWEAGEKVRVEARSGAGEALEPLHAKRAVITLPLGVLKAPRGAPGAVRFVPDLPESKRETLTRLEMGPVVKVILRFAEAFWENDEKLEELVFLHATDDESFPTWWTSLPFHAPILTGWAGGPAADRLSRQSQRSVLDQALGTLSRLLGVDRPALAALLQSWHVCDWQQDPFSRGAYSYVKRGGDETPRSLGAPVQDTLFFAGEATHGGLSGTVAGAIASGRRAASEVRRAMAADASSAQAPAAPSL